jgi:hypothetical protein
MTINYHKNVIITNNDDKTWNELPNLLLDHIIISSLIIMQLVLALNVH